MKDPHLGAFGLLGMVAFLLGEVALFAQIYDKPYVLFPVWVGFAAARMAGACAVVSILLCQEYRTCLYLCGKQ